MNRTLEVAVVGAGYFAQFHLQAWQRIANVKLTAIVEQDTGKHAQLATTYPSATITDDLTAIDPLTDIVDIVTGPNTHAEQIQKTFDHTQALVICQKPFCGNNENAAVITELAIRLKRTIVVHENFRFQPWYSKIKSALNDQMLGEVQQATFRLRTGDGQGANAYLDRQPYFQDMPRLLIHETGVHFIDVFRYLFGEPDAVHADLRRLNQHIAGEDAGYFVFNYDNGLRAMFDGNRHLDHGATNTRLTLGEMLIEGTKGSLSLDGNGELSFRAFGAALTEPLHYDHNNNGFAGDCVYHLQTHVVEHLLNNAALQNSASDYMRNLQLVELVYESSASQRTLLTQ